MYVDAFYRIYNKINESGKETSKAYKDNLLICFFDIQELNQKIQQTIASLGVKEYSLKINMEQSEGEDHTFNNFDDFAKHNITSPYATQEIFFYYKFIIYNEEANIFENYSVSFKLTSRIATFEQLRKDSPPFMLELISPMKTVVAFISVEYYDYVKARSFISTFDEWVKGCDVYNMPKSLEFAKKIAPALPKVGTLVMLVIFTFLSIKSIPDHIENMTSVGKIVMFYISAFFITQSVTTKLLQYMSKKINESIPLSYIKINKGDEKIIKDYESNTSKSIKKSCAGLLAAIIIGISTNFIYDGIKILFFPHT